MKHKPKLSLHSTDLKFAQTAIKAFNHLLSVSVFVLSWNAWSTNHTKNLA